MHLRACFILLAVGTANLGEAPLVAQATQPAPNVQSQKPKDPNETVCERQREPGSRLASARVCHTRAEWADLRQQDRQMVDKAQTQLGTNGH